MQDRAPGAVFRELLKSMSSDSSARLNRVSECLGSDPRRADNIQPKLSMIDRPSKFLTHHVRDIRTAALAFK
jgi:hypothetical protein